MLRLRKLFALVMCAVLVLSLVGCKIEWPAIATASVQFKDGMASEYQTNDCTAKVGGHYVVPLVGGKVTAQIGGWVENAYPFTYEFYDLDAFLAYLRSLGVDIRVREFLASTTVNMDALNPDNGDRLFEFNGSLEEFLAQPGLRLIYFGRRGFEFEMDYDIAGASAPYMLLWELHIWVPGVGMTAQSDVKMYVGGACKYIDAQPDKHWH